MITGLAAFADLVADRRLDLQLAARRQPESDIVAHAAGDPAILGDTRHRGEAHAGGAADDVEDRRHRIDPPDRCDIELERRWLSRDPHLHRTNLGAIRGRVTPYRHDPYQAALWPAHP